MCNPERACGAAIGVTVDEYYGLNRESAFDFSDSARVQTVVRCLRWPVPESFSRENKKGFAAQSRLLQESHELLGGVAAALRDS
jgi:hypothetical protein